MKNLVKFIMSNGKTALVSPQYVTAVVEMDEMYGENLVSIWSGNDGPPIHVHMTVDEIHKRLKEYGE